MEILYPSNTSVLELAKGLKKIDLKGLDLKNVKHWLKKGKKMVEDGFGSYCLIIANKTTQSNHLYKKFNLNCSFKFKNGLILNNISYYYFLISSHRKTISF